MQKALLDTQSKIKIEKATEGLKKWFITRLENHEHKTNALTIANFLIAPRNRVQYHNQLQRRFNFHSM